MGFGVQGPWNKGNIMLAINLIKVCQSSNSLNKSRICRLQIPNTLKMPFSSPLMKSRPDLVFDPNLLLFSLSTDQDLSLHKEELKVSRDRIIAERAEKRRLAVETKRKEQEELKKKEQEEQERMEKMREEMEQEKQRKIEEFRLAGKKIIVSYLTKEAVVGCFHTLPFPTPIQKLPRNHEYPWQPFLSLFPQSLLKLWKLRTGKEHHK